MTKKDSSNPMLLNLLHRSRSMKKLASSSFPQPTRPEDVASPRPPCTPPYPQWEFTHPSPRPSTPSPSSYLQQIGYPRFVPERWFQTPRGGEIGHDGDREESNEEGYEEIIGQILELYEKLPGKVKEKVSMELVRNIVGNRININNVGGATTGQVGLTVGSSTTSCRGLDNEVQASPHRLERFKVRTIKVGGAPTNDDEENQPKR